VLVPIGSAIVRGHVIHRAWDRFAVPWPFTRVAVVLGAPLSEGDDIAARIAATNADAAALLMVRCT